MEMRIFVGVGWILFYIQSVFLINSILPEITPRPQRNKSATNKIGFIKKIIIRRVLVVKKEVLAKSVFVPSINREHFMNKKQMNVVWAYSVFSLCYRCFP
jgi:hypothetical protein